MEVPDGDGGDYGIEGYTKCGKAYQCYCPAASTMRQWREGITNKINTDIKKLKSNMEYFQKIFDNGFLKSWHLVLPVYRSSNLAPHCKKKSNEVKKWGLPFIDEEFHITIETDDTYASAKRELLNGNFFSLNFNHIPPAEEEIDASIEGEGAFFEALRTKTQKLGSGERGVSSESWFRQYIRYHIHGQRYLDTLKDGWPDTYAEIINAKAQREMYLIEEMARSADPLSLISRVQELYQSDIKSILYNANKQIIEALTREAVADWLIRCNLDFIVDGHDI